MIQITSIKYDVSDVESGGGGTEPTPGLYPGKIASVNHRTKKNDGTPINDLEVVVDIGAEYVRLWTYIKLPGDPSYDNARWKLREFTDALGLPPKGAIDPKKVEGKPVMVKTKFRRDDPERAEIKNLFKPGSEKLSAADADALAEGEGETDYASWSIEELEAELLDRNIDVPAGRKTVAKLAAVLAENDGAGEAEPEAEAEEDAAFDIVNVEGFEDWEEWSSDDLKEYLKDNEIKLEGRYSEQKARAAIIESVAGDFAPEAKAEAEGEGEAAASEDDYDEWTDDELKAEVKDRTEQGAEMSISGRWTRDKAIAAMREDDAANPF